MENFSSVYRREKNIFLIFLSLALTIILLHLSFHPVRVFDMGTSIFYMDEKYTLASFFTTITAFLVGYLALTRQSEKGKRKLTGWVYGLFFLVLAFDEYFEVHEYFNTVIKSILADGSWFKTLSILSWIFPLSFIVLMVFILFGLKIKQASKRVRAILLWGSLCFAVVLLLELVGGPTYGNDIYLYLVAAEEGSEMIGVSLFLLATLIETKESELR